MMRYALLLSIFVHFLLVFSLKIDLDLDNESRLYEPNLNAGVLQVRFFKLKAINATCINEDSHRQLHPNKQGEIGRASQKKLEQYANYLKPSEVDITAIPLHELAIRNELKIDSTIITYHLRIFVDKNGEVNQVINWDDKTTTLASYAEVANQVKRMIFIPAKKNGVVVDSFIDIALEV